MFGQRIVYALLITTVCLACFVMEYLINCIRNKHPRIITNLFSFCNLIKLWKVV